MVYHFGMKKTNPIKKALEAMPSPELMRFSLRCKVPYATLNKIKYGATLEPRKATTEKINAALKKLAK
jgi:hypothetical protein